MRVDEGGREEEKEDGGEGQGGHDIVLYMCRMEAYLTSFVMAEETFGSLSICIDDML
jgi:hypothetical protein